MLFSTNIFIFAFFPITLIGYFLCSLIPLKGKHANALKNLFLLAASLFFYYWGSGKLILLLFLSVAINYFSALAIVAARGDIVRKWLIGLCVALNLFLLLYFKYAGFFYSIVQSIASLGGAVMPVLAPIILPIGISFYTFQAMSYTLDVYRANVPVQKNPLKLMLYISFFPQLIAGPIVRYSTVQQEIDTRSSSLEGVYNGFCRFAVGLGKKVLLADTFGVFSSQILGLPFEELSAPVAWLGLFYYTMQIYFDFSGYSDMAIGMAEIFGFHFLENFRLPYTSHNITEFWQRWHISLSTWFRDYLYIPLGGNRRGNGRTYFNLFMVFLLCGLWHGANYTFLVWGLFHGLLLVFERLLKHRFGFAMSGAVGRVATVLLVGIGWVFFMSPNLPYAFAYLGRMFCLTQPAVAPYFTLSWYLPPNVVFFVVIGVLAGFFRWNALREKIARVTPLKGIAALVIFALAAAFLSKATFTPFIYFQF